MNKFSLKELRKYCGFYRKEWCVDSVDEHICDLRHAQKEDCELLNRRVCADLETCPVYQAVVKTLVNT